jgi:hypothetical protein
MKPTLRTLKNSSNSRLKKVNLYRKFSGYRFNNKIEWNRLWDVYMETENKLDNHIPVIVSDDLEFIENVRRFYEKIPRADF